jgi:sec-independent protein translocase protein TatB
MPQIGWFEILIIVVLAIIIVGPKDVPIVLKKIGGWTNSIKRYFSDIQKDVTDIENIAQKEISKEIFLDKKYLNKDKNNKKDE